MNGCQVLTDFIVQVARQSFAFFFLQVDDLLGQPMVAFDALLQRAGHAVEFIADGTELYLCKQRQATFVLAHFNLVETGNNLLYRLEGGAYGPEYT